MTRLRQAGSKSNACSVPRGATSPTPGSRAVSHENRFDAAYKAILQCAMAALNARGYRTLTSRPGHHQTALQTLSLTISLPAERLIVLDALRKQRNLSDYSGDLVPLSAVRECIACAAELLDDVTGWLRGHHPQLLG